MSSHAISHILAAALAVALFAGAQHAAAQSAGDSATAQALFEQGKQLVTSGNAVKACPKFEESQHLDPRSGTLIDLASCYEQTGRLASAWGAYIDAASSAKTSGNAEREKVARDRATALAPKLSKLVITVSPALQSLSGLEVARDGVVVHAPEWGTPLPADAGEHEVTAKAPGHAPWQTKITVKGEAQTTTVTVPELAAAADGDNTAAPAANDSWSAAISKGAAQERANETEQERKRREENAARPSNEALDAPFRVLHFAVYLAGGWLTYNSERMETSDVHVALLDNFYVKSNGGLMLSVALGGRYGLSRQWDVQARVSLAHQATGAAMSSASCASIPCPSAITGASFSSTMLILDTTARARPSAPSPLYVGLGGRIGAEFNHARVSGVSMSGVAGATSVPFTMGNVGYTYLTFGPIAEVGTLLGSNQQFELGLRGGPMWLGHDSEDLGVSIDLTAGWVFF